MQWSRNAVCSCPREMSTCVWGREKVSLGERGGVSCSVIWLPFPYADPVPLSCDISRGAVSLGQIVLSEAQIEWVRLCVGLFFSFFFFNVFVILKWPRVLAQLYGVNCRKQGIGHVASQKFNKYLLVNGRPYSSTTSMWLWMKSTSCSLELYH